MNSLEELLDVAVEEVRNLADSPHIRDLSLNEFIDNWRNSSRVLWGPRGYKLLYEVYLSRRSDNAQLVDQADGSLCHNYDDTEGFNGDGCRRPKGHTGNCGDK